MSYAEVVAASSATGSHRRRGLADELGPRGPDHSRLDRIPHATPAATSHRYLVKYSRFSSSASSAPYARTVCASPDNEPSSLHNHRHLVFTLERSRAVYNAVPWIAACASSRALGQGGLKKARLRSAFTAMLLNVADRGDKPVLPGFVNDTQPLFEPAHGRGGSGWRSE
ncbi:hypothetical protein F4825DRAFT_280503 [Nemania diffusa]|nr:hypothetical protein F4825DRAFT_280503 [Nemania diffusa]